MFVKELCTCDLKLLLFTFFFLWHNSATWAKAAWLLRFLAHTQLDTHTPPVGLIWTSDYIVVESANYALYNKRISITLAEFEPAVLAIEWP